MVGVLWNAVYVLPFGLNMSSSSSRRCLCWTVVMSLRRLVFICVAFICGLFSRLVSEYSSLLCIGCSVLMLSCLCVTRLIICMYVFGLYMVAIFGVIVVFSEFVWFVNVICVLACSCTSRMMFMFWLLVSWCTSTLGTLSVVADVISGVIVWISECLVTFRGGPLVVVELDRVVG